MELSLIDFSIDLWYREITSAPIISLLLSIDFLFRADMFSNNRILISRIFAFIFLLIFFFSEPALENTGWEALLFLFGLILVGIATVGRLWCSLYISGRKSSRLVIHGPHSVSRNPLYFFSFLGVIGLGLATEIITLALFLSFSFLLSYRLVIHSEERFLENTFGDSYRSYCATVPRFLPKWSQHIELGTLEVAPKIFLRSVYEALWFAGLVGLLEFLEGMKELIDIPSLFQLY